MSASTRERGRAPAEVYSGNRGSLAGDALWSYVIDVERAIVSDLRFELWGGHILFYGYGRELILETLKAANVRLPPAP